jgi:hypothetical protein
MLTGDMPGDAGLAARSPELVELANDLVKQSNLNRYAAVAIAISIILQVLGSLMRYWVRITSDTV